MENENPSSRRRFLKNVVLASAAFGIIPLPTDARPRPVLESEGACNPTTLDYYGVGPFYTANAPFIQNNQLAGQTEPGTRIILSGRVRTLDCTQVIADTLIDIWHANDAGAYDNAAYNLRGKTQSNAQGFYLFETVLPGKYLNGSAYRPRHIHFKITPPGFPTLVTQLYFQGDTDIPGDAAASLTSGTYDATHRIIPIALNGQGVYEGSWDIVVDGTGVAREDLHLEKGLVYSASPNPFTESLEIRYGVFEPAKVSISVFNLEGKLVATLEEKFHSPQKYTVVWKPESRLPSGTYFVTLKVNDMQVHYLKVMKG